jgi:L-aspartate oxidase
MRRYLLKKPFSEIEKVYYDTVIIGSGIAGVYTALCLNSEKETVIITKDTIDMSNSVLAQGGIAVSLDKGDSPALHFQDTLTAGAGLCNEESVWVLVNEAADRIERLLEFGVQFDRKSKDELAFGREAAHSKNRIIHAGDTTGKEVCDKLILAAKNRKNITIIEKVFAVDLITEGQEAKGVLAYDEKKKEFVIFVSDAIVCAAGGFGRLYKMTTNPDVATGDGVCMAYRAGAFLADMEFVQFHPTVLYHPENKHFLISEAVRGEGAVLRNQKKERFMHRYHKLEELAPRDVVARAIFTEMQKDQAENVFLDITFKDREYLMNRFPNIFKTCLGYGIDMSKNYIPVAPAEHYCMGGIKTDVWGRTNIKGFYACGEAACTGIHGANRLASNSLLEGLVFGGNIARILNRQGRKKEKITIRDACLPEYALSFEDKDLEIKEHIREIMTSYVGIVRNKEGLETALKMIREYISLIEKKEPLIPEHFEIYNMLQLAEVITENALLREESRGAHFRSDFTSPDDKQKKSIIREIGKEVRYDTEPHVY